MRAILKFSIVWWLLSLILLVLIESNPELGFEEFAGAVVNVILASLFTAWASKEATKESDEE